MNAPTFLNRQNQNRQWFPMSRKNHRHLAPVNLVPRKSHIHSVKSLRTLANSKVKQGDYSSAIALLTQLINLNPTSASDYNNRGLLYFQSGQPYKALFDYNQALRIDPTLDSAYNNRANYYASVGQLAEALTDYEQAIDINPGNIRTWINQAITFRDLGLYDLALENLDMALMLGCLEDHVYAQRGRTYHLRGDWNCAISDYQKALKCLPKSASSDSLGEKVENWINDLLQPLRA